jgi:hypothetical protein
LQPGLKRARRVSGEHAKSGVTVARVTRICARLTPSFNPDYKVLMPVKFSDLQDAYLSSDFGRADGMNQVFICKETGRLYFHSELDPELDEMPADFEENEEKYLPIPDKRELDLGQRLVFDFARQFLPRDIDEIDRIFSKKGAYARFKILLERRHLLDKWYEFENNAEERALREWCELNGIDVVD